MKKFYSFALIMLTLFSSVFFFACGNKYKKLEMSFYSTDGVSLTDVELTIDSTDASKATTKVGVKFSGIDEDEIGQVLIYSSPSGVVTISNYIYENDYVWVTLNANSPSISTDTKLMVRHLDSNKLASINLKVQQKSTDVEIKNSNYIISVPTDEDVVNTHTIQANQLLSLLPVGSTDLVYFKEKNAYYSDSDTSKLTQTIDGVEYITGYETTKDSTGSVTIYPVTVLNGEIKEYTNKTITITFTKTLTNDNLFLKLDSKYGNNAGTENNPVNLIYNDTITNSVVATLNYGSVEVETYYSLSLSSSNKNAIMVSDKGGNEIVVQATAHTSGITEKAIVSFVPNGYVGDIQTITKELFVIGEAKADSITVKKADKEIDASQVIDLYDYYASGNALGAKFNFIPKTYINAAVHQDLRTMQIVISPSILNINNGTDGYNLVYTDSTFTTQQSTLSTWRKNYYVLDISLAGRAMKFYSDGTNLISEEFTQSSTIYIKFSTIATNSTNNALTLDVKTICSSSLEYLNNTSSTTQTLNFNEKAGVKEMSVSAGYFTLNEYSQPSSTSYGSISNGIYLNRLYGVDNEDVTAAYSQDDVNLKSQLVQLTNIKGVDGTEITATDLLVTVTAKNTVTNSLMVTQGVSKNWDTDADKDVISSNYTTNLDYEYRNTGVNYLLGLYFTTTTDVGEYTITISQPETGFSVSISAWVYEDFEDADITEELETTSKSFKNETFTDYKADYIISAGESLNLGVLLSEDQMNSHIVKGYSISPAFTNTSLVDDYGYNVLEYLNYSLGSENNKFTLNFLKGTYLEEANQYITLTLTVTKRTYTNIITEGEEQPVTNGLTFFIYEPISYSDLSITAPTTKYMYDYLGVYYKETDSQEELKITMDSELWHYVQAKEQKTAENVGINNDYKTVWVADANFNFTQTLSQTDNSIKLQFNKTNNTSLDDAYSITLTAIIYQFNTPYTLKCTINVERAIIANRVVVDNVNIKNTGEYYIDLQKGDEYTVSAHSLSDYGAVTHEEFVIQVFDENGNANQTDVTINPNTLTLKVENVQAGYKIVVFAKDALAYIASNDVVGYNTPDVFMLDYKYLNKYLHKNAYVVIDLYLSDGESEDTAYIIDSADDFWAIADEHDNVTYTNTGAPFYKVMTNLDLSNTTSKLATIANFKGTIITDYVIDKDSNKIYSFFTLYGLTLGGEGNLTNLFTNFNGTIRNIQFVVTYKYNTTISSNVNLGLIDKNNGTLTNVSCEINGTSTIDVETGKTAIAYFGGLVGENCGKLEFTDAEKQCIGTSGNITVLGSAQVYFGGLVGKNLGTITGYELSTNATGSDIEFVSLSDAGMTSNLNITAGLSNSASAVGGVVGLNGETGTIKNAEVGGTITGVYEVKDADGNVTTTIKTNNLGGLVGENKQNATIVTATADANYLTGISDFSASAQISYVKSYATIIGGNNIGGVVGTDTNGVYSNIMYQITADTETALLGENYVGGIAGSSNAGKVVFCSVMSYKWDYLDPDFSISADIKAVNNVGGIVGGAKTYIEFTWGTDNSATNAVVIHHSSVNAYLSSENKAGGILSYSDTNSGMAIVKDAYFMGAINATTTNYLDSSNDAIYNITYYIVYPTTKTYVNASYTYNSSSWETDSVHLFLYDAELEQYYSAKGTSHSVAQTYYKREGCVSSSRNSGYNNLIIDKNPNLSYWWYNSNLNGGYIYVTTEQNPDATNNAPIFEIAPTKIEVTVEEKLDSDKDGSFDDEDNPYYVNSSTLWLPYYKFTGAETGSLTTEILSELNTKFNTIKNLTSFLKFTITPSGGARLKVSSNSSILTVNENGELIVRGTGECELTFSSRLNSDVKASLKVVITYPTGNDLKLINVETNQQVSAVNIAKGTSKLFTISTSGYEPYSGINYYYETNSNINLDAIIEYTGDDLYYYTTYVENNDWESKKTSLYTKDSNGTYNLVGTDDEYSSSTTYYEKKIIDDVNKVLTISNGTLVADYREYTYNTDTWDDDNDNLYKLNGSDYEKIADNSTYNSEETYYKLMYNVTIPAGTPFSITVKQKVENTFTFNVTPYISIVNKPLPTQTFTLTTANGPSAISLSYNSAILYPNNTTIITAYITTDIELTAIDLSNIISASTLTLKDANGEVITSGYEILIYSIYSNYDATKGIQTVQFEIDIKSLDSESEKRFLDVKINVASVSASVDYTILPQRINSIEIKNYYKDENNYVLSNVLQQDKNGLIIIDMAPYNGYFDYLEIVDASGNEEILFTQIDGKEGNTLAQINKPADYGKGIQLVKNYTNYNNRIYVRTSIDASYSSSVHTIIVYAFLSDGTCLTPNGAQYDIEVKMLPQITAEYRLPSGDVGSTASTESGYISNIEIDLAIGTDATFYVTTRESDDVITPSLADYSGNATNIYKFEQDNNNFWKLVYTGDPTINFNSYLGNSLKLTLTTQSYLNNGNTATAEISYTITLVNFVIHDVSVSNSTDSNGITQIYGNINQEIDLELYFKPTDISYYVNGNYWDSTYRFDMANNKLLANDSEFDNEYILDILCCLNMSPSSYLALRYEIKDEYKVNYQNIKDKAVDKRSEAEKALLEEIETTKDYVTLKGKKLTITNEDYNKYFNVYLDINFELVKNGHNFEMNSTVTNPTISKSYKLNFVPATSPYEPKLIKNEEDFLSMSTGYYILGADLILDNYTPLTIVEPQEEGDAQLIEFDGNGRTITITSFNTDELTDAAMLVGLFKNIPEGTTIKNVTVKYLSISDSGNYTLGKVNTEKKTNDFVIESYFDLCANQTVNYTSASFGGIAATNNGVITNCNVMGEIAIRVTTVEQKKYASDSSSNYEIDFYIGGLVATNASTGYITNSKSALRIFSQANIGGFVYENKGKIVSSAVDTLTDYSLTEDERIQLENGTYVYNNVRYLAATNEEYQPLVYNYNSLLEKTIVVELGGFAVVNSGEISMSYANYFKTGLKDSKLSENINVIGNLSAKDLSAGFIYTNSGTISDAYVIINKAGNNNNEFYGFVYTNSGSITYAYTFINAGNWDNNSYMFAKNGTTGLNNCVELVNYDSSYTKNASTGLHTELVTNSFNRNTYEQYGFAFGDNSTAVWKIYAGLPQLVSTTEEVVYTENKDVSATITNSKGEEYVYYYGLKNITVKTTYVTDEETGAYTKTTEEKTDHSSYGTKANPIIILNRVEANGSTNWDSYFTEENATKYFRIVTDIDFSSVNKNPTTSTLTFSGNIQGNNMNLTGIMLYSTNSLESIGLFKEIISISNISTESSIRNLTLSTTSVWATKTNAVGILAGVIENYKLYNIHINSENVTIVGGNAVGGVAGVIRGNFDIHRLSSNVGANSTRASSSYSYAIYASINTGVTASENLSSVYYAGSVAGIVDGYNSGSFNIADTRDISTSTYFKARDISVNGAVVLLADTVGGAFGFVGERVKVENVEINLTSAKLSGTQYSAGAVGENRGVVNNANVTISSSTAFANSTYVSAGVVGLNAGGLVQNATANFSCEKASTTVTLGGIIGRNIYGIVTNSTFNGQIVGYVTGGIVGSNYEVKTLKQMVTGSGALTEECKNNAKLLPTSQVEYKNNGVEINNFENTAISTSTLAFFLQNITKFYAVSNNENFADAISYKKVLGLCIGLTDSSDYVISSYGIVGENNSQVLGFNMSSYKTTSSVGVVSLVVGTKETTDEDDNKITTEIKQEWPCANIIKLSDITFLDSKGKTLKLTGTYMTYITGAVVASFDNWLKDSYAADMLVLTDQTATNPMWSFDGTDVSYLISIESIITEAPTQKDAEGITTTSYKTITYTYVLRDLVDTPSMKFTLPKDLFEDFVYDIDHDNDASTDKTSVSITGTSNLTAMPTGNTSTTITCTSNTYTLTISGYASETINGTTYYYPLTYTYIFKVV